MAFKNAHDPVSMVSLTRTSLTRVVVPPPVHWNKDDEDKLLGQIAEYYCKNKENLSRFSYADACKPSGYKLNKKTYNSLQSRIKRLRAKRRNQRQSENMLRCLQKPPGGQQMFTGRTALGKIQTVNTSFRNAAFAFEKMRQERDCYFQR